jgi:hypothetical protein
MRQPPQSIDPRSRAFPRELLALAMVFAASCASTPARDAREPVPSAATRGLALHAKLWRSHRLRDYVFVLDQQSMVVDVATLRLRVVVADGHVRSASSLLYGGSPDLAFVPTIDALFQRAERMARGSRRGAPHRFDASYDTRYGFPLHVWSDLSPEIADDESGFDVSCFSPEPDGCSAIPMTPEQCSGAGGRVVDIATALWCGPNSPGSIGLVAEDAVCCRDWQADGTNSISSAQCEAAGGHLAECGNHDVTVGTVTDAGRPCCRRLVR